MEKKKCIYSAMGGFGLGILLMVLLWAVGLGTDTDAASLVAGTESAAGAEAYAPAGDESTADAGSGGGLALSLKALQAEQTTYPVQPEENAQPVSAEQPEGHEQTVQAVQPASAEQPEGYGQSAQAVQTDAPALMAKAASSADTWDRTAVYLGGDTVSYQGKKYRAKWWTQGEVPGSSDVWEELGTAGTANMPGAAEAPAGTNEPGEAAGTAEEANTPADAAEKKETELTDCKVVGYYPSWKPDRLDSVDFGIVTHVCYAFAIPTADGGLMDLENPKTAKKLIASAHKNGAKVLLSVGGWSYNDTPLEGVFMEATSSSKKIKKLAKSIVKMCDKYGFDGVDMDWEHPRVDGKSAKQYEKLMLLLAKKLHAKDKLLTAAVLSGVTADGNVYYDAAAQTDAVLDAVDFINVMAYDGGDGERHSSYQFALNCGNYWKKTRGMPAHKVVLGVPFYARPSWAEYGAILEAVPGAYKKDHVKYNGMDVYYNGVKTIKKKAVYAKKHLGGIMVWELTQDTTDQGKSLLQAIGKSIR